jgi:glycerophosphoryl diester phosphodiesterase
MLKIGHRGACGYAPENTLLSFRKAIKLKVSMVELDVHICKSGEVVVIHDDVVDRTTNGKGPVAKKILEELKSLDAGKGEKIPTFEEVLILINREFPINIELKGKNTAKPVADLIEKYVSKGRWTYDDFLVSSFNYKEITLFHQLCKKVKTGYLIKNIPLRYIVPARKIGAYSINPPLKYITKKIVDKCHSNGFKVFVWTVNNREDIGRMKSLGVDGIFSNYPDRI